MQIKQIRVSKGWSQNRLAVMSGVSQPCIHYMESGKKAPTTRTLKKIAKALDVPMAVLLAGGESV